MSNYTTNLGLKPTLPFLEDSVVFSNGIIYRSKYKNNKHETPYPKVSLDNNRAYYALAQNAKLPDMSTETILTKDQAEKAYQDMVDTFQHNGDLPLGQADYIPTGSSELYDNARPNTAIVFILKNAVVTSTGPIKLFKSSSVIPYLLITNIDIHNMHNTCSYATLECEDVYGASMYELKTGTEFAKSLDPTSKSKEELRESYVKAYDSKNIPPIILDGLYSSYMLWLVSGETDQGSMYDTSSVYGLLPEIHSIYTDCIELDMNPHAPNRVGTLQELYHTIQVGSNPGEWKVTING